MRHFAALQRKLVGWPLVVLTHLVAMLLGVGLGLALDGGKVLALIAGLCVAGVAACAMMLAEPEEPETRGR